MPKIEDWSAVDLGGRVLGTTLYGALGTQIVNAVERKESLDGVLPTIGAIVEYAAAAVEKDFKRWAPRLDEFFDALSVSPMANTLFSRFASERISRRRRPYRLLLGARRLSLRNPVTCRPQATRRYPSE